MEGRLMPTNPVSRHLRTIGAGFLRTPLEVTLNEGRPLLSEATRRERRALLTIAAMIVLRTKLLPAGPDTIVLLGFPVPIAVVMQALGWSLVYLSIGFLIYACQDLLAVGEARAKLVRA